VPAEDANRREQLARIAFRRTSSTHFEREVAPDHQCIDVRLEPRFEIAQLHPPETRVGHQRIALVVQK
jgi:hypothetical protein